MIEPRKSQGRPSVPEPVRAESAKRTAALRAAIGRDRGITVTKLAKLAKINRAALSHVLHDRVLCTPGLYKTLAFHLGIEEELVAPMQPEIDTTEQDALIAQVVDHPDLSSLGTQMKLQIARSLYDSLLSTGISPASLTSTQLSGHLLPIVVKQVREDSRPVEVQAINAKEEGYAR